MVLVFLVVAPLLSGCGQNATREHVADGGKQAYGTRANAGCDSPLHPGPRTLCPDGQAVRRVLEKAGFDVFGSQGGSWYVTDHSNVQR